MSAAPNYQKCAIIPKLWMSEHRQSEQAQQMMLLMGASNEHFRLAFKQSRVAYYNLTNQCNG